ncbi:MAG: polysulfide reductase NrfD [Desulfobacterales bacterium]|nr:polysulfide reductase NrfD [Desulfobacterales bacterium]MCP4159502.1 polysulfide reductase NrfD [Deltaproteobacteria bacterium]
MDKTKLLKGILSFVKDIITWNLKGSRAYHIYLLVLLGLIMVGVCAYIVQFREGLAVTNMSNIVSWGFYISNFTFLVGVAAAAVMLILPSYIFNDKDLHKVVIIGEVVAVGALVMCMTFIFVDLGRPLQFWHLVPGPGELNFPSSILSWDIIVLNGYLVLNAMIPAYILYCHYQGKEPVGKYYKPFVFISIGWAVAIHMVTAFLYQGLPARPFWNNPLMGPRFLASAFAAGPAIISCVLYFINNRTTYKIEEAIFNKLRIIIVSAAVINLLMLFSEIFKEFYFPTHHSQSAVYLFFGLKGHNSLVPWIWTAIVINLAGTIVLAVKPKEGKFTVPALVLLIIGIWIEKGIGLIVPGLVPSPMGEITSYAPSGVELLITVGIVGLGMFVITMLLRPALIIEQKYEEEHGH